MQRIRMRSSAALVAIVAAAGAHADVELLDESVVLTGERLTADQVEGRVLLPAEIERLGVLTQTGPEAGRRMRNGAPGVWAVAKERGRLGAPSGENYIVNTWGDTRMGIDFGGVVDLAGAHILGHGAPTTGLVVVGFRDGVEVGRTDAFRGIGEDPSWFEMQLAGVDRVEFVSETVVRGGGWYGVDNLTFRGDGDAEMTVLDFDDLEPGDKLAKAGYAGLTWEAGTGEFIGEFEELDVNVIPAPVESILPGDDVEIPVEESRGASRGLGTSPSLINDFTGVRLGNAFAGSIPPDTHGAVGPNHYVTVVNTAYRVYQKNFPNSLLQQNSIGSIMPGTSGDPRVKYDQYEDRFVAVSTNFNNRIYMAVSLTSNPLDGWFSFNWVASTGSDSGCFPDYPTLGISEDGYYVGALMAGCGFSLFTIEKAPLVAGAPSVGTITAFRSLNVFSTPQPAHTFGTGQTQFVVARNSNSQARHFRVNGPLTSPSLSNFTNMTVPGGINPPDAPALGSNSPLDTLDGRYMNSITRDGSTYWCRTVRADGGRTGIQWVQADLLANTVQDAGLVQDDTLYFNMPSIGVNGRGSIVLGFSGSNASQYASCYFCGRIPSDPAGEMSDPVLYQAGNGGINHFDSFGRNRFGDYSHTAIDPSDDNRFWTIQEWGGTGNDWVNEIAELELIALPDDFALELPANGAMDLDAQSAINLDWEDALDADDYTVEVYEDAGLTTLAIPAFQVGSSNAAIGAGQLADNEEYFWTVVASNVTGTNSPSPDASFSFTTADVPSPCPGDVDGDGDTDVFDFADLSANFGAGPGATREMGDLTGDGFVDVFDFGELSADFGCPNN